MPFTKTCAYEPCSKPFVTRFRRVRYCSVSCGSKSRVIENPDDVRQYLLQHIEVPSNPDHCWIWTGHIKSTGYGIACVRNKRILAHRLVYEIFVGPLPPHLYILHGNTCHSRACVNPAHVRLGTHIENMHDRRDWGAQPRGEEHYAAQLTETQVLHILEAFHKHKQPMAKIARQRRLAIMTVHDIIYRLTWTHVAPGQYPAPRDQRATLTPDQVREIRRLYEQEGWTYQAIRKHMNRRYPDLHLTYDTTGAICRYQTWVNLSPQDTPAPPAVPQETFALDAAAVRQMREEYAAACAAAAAQGLRVKITRFAEPYAAKYRITNMAVRLILKGQTWKHVTLSEPASEHGTCDNHGPYCNCCGDCLVCYATMPCHNSDDLQHVWPASVATSA